MPVHTTPESPHTKEQQAFLARYYQKCGVENGSHKEKISALEKSIGERAFFAFGGGETEEMELRSNELVFLEESDAF